MMGIGGISAGMMMMAMDGPACDLTTLPNGDLSTDDIVKNGVSQIQEIKGNVMLR